MEETIRLLQKTLKLLICCVINAVKDRWYKAYTELELIPIIVLLEIMDNKAEKIPESMTLGGTVIRKNLARQYADESLDRYLILCWLGRYEECELIVCFYWSCIGVT